MQRQTHVRVHTSRVTNFAFDTYPRKTHFERRTAQKLARTTFRVVPNCARGGGGWIKSSSSLASEASALAFGQPARFARGLDNILKVWISVSVTVIPSNLMTLHFIFRIFFVPPAKVRLFGGAPVASIAAALSILGGIHRHVRCPPIS